ncbi:MAG: hypothetical protein IV100_15480 [Myxococcales bacterium]|nr:hypothetical protein [Myxococcales bacterium]
MRRRPARTVAGLVTVTCWLGLVGCAKTSDTVALGPETGTPDTSSDSVSSELGGDEVKGPETCVIERTIACGEVIDGDTTAGSRSVASLSCDPAGLALGASPERLYRFTADRATLVRFSVESDAALLLAVLADGCDDAACVMGRPWEASLAVADGESRTVLVDGLDGDSGAFRLRAECCTPSCAGKSCGDDGCGGSCGTCGGGEVCDLGTCTVASCSAGETLDCGATLVNVDSDGPGSTSTIPATSCKGYDYSGPERVYLFESTFEGTLVVRLPQWDASEKLDVSLFRDGGAGCDPATCVDSGIEGASAPVSPGDRVFIVVDGYEGNTSKFDLSVECCVPDCSGRECGDDGCGGSCGACGESIYCNKTTGQCEDVVCTPSAELVCGQTLSGVASDGPGSSNLLFTSGCVEQDYSAPEQVYSFVAPNTATFRFNLPPFDENEDLDVFILADQEGLCKPENCVTFGFSGAVVDLEAGERVYVVVDGYQGNVSPFNLTVDCCDSDCGERVCGPDGCGGSCGTCFGGKACSSDGTACVDVAPSDNDDCTTADVISALPFETGLDTTGAADDYTVGGTTGCVEQYEGGHDLVWTYTPAVTGPISITLLPSDTSDGVCNPAAPNSTCSPKVLYVMDACPDVATKCLAANDYYFAPETSLTVNAFAGQTLFIVVDGFDGNENGVGTLRVE